MQILLIYACQNQESLCAFFKNEAMAIAKRRGHRVVLRDLYEMGFDPVLREEELSALHQEGLLSPAVVEEQKWISWADLLLFIYPIWWWDRPAILKGWFDRVWTQGFSFKVGKTGVEGLLRGKRAAILRSAGQPQVFYERSGGELALYHGLKDGALAFCGVEPCAQHTLYELQRAKPARRKMMTQEALAFLEEQMS